MTKAPAINLAAATEARPVRGRQSRLGFMLPVLVGALAVHAHAQCPPQWLPNVGVPGTNGTVRAVAVLSSLEVIVGGSFTAAGGAAINYIARWNAATGAWSALGSGTSSSVNALLLHPGGDLFIGGDFTVAGGFPAGRIARFNPGTGTWSSLGAGADNAVLALAVLPDGDIVAGGAFTFIDGVAANTIARYRPSTSAWSALGTGTDGVVLAIAALPDGDVIAGGSFSTAGGVPARNIARFHAQAGAWSALGSGVGPAGSTVAALLVISSGDVIVGGSFASAGGVPSTNIASYSPGTGAWSLVGGMSAGTNGAVSALALHPSGDVLVGGSFTVAGGVAANRIAHCNPYPVIWSSMGSGTNNTVRAIASLPDGDVIAGGSFTSAGGYAAGSFAVYDLGAPAPHIWTQPQDASVCERTEITFSVAATGANPLSYQWRKDGEPISPVDNPSAMTDTLILGSVQPSHAGPYDCIIGSSCGSTASWTAFLHVLACPCNVADIGGIGGEPPPDGLLTGDDFNAFINAFAAGDPPADITGIGGPPELPDGLITGDDFNAFIAAFATGCP